MGTDHGSELSWGWASMYHDQGPGQGGSLSISRSPLVKSPSEFFFESPVPNFRQLDSSGSDTTHHAGGDSEALLVTHPRV